MIPKSCLLTDKGKLEATLQGHCAFYGDRTCVTCSYCKPDLLAEQIEMEKAMEEWAKALKENEKIKIELGGL